MALKRLILGLLAAFALLWGGYALLREVLWLQAYQRSTRDLIISDLDVSWGNARRMAAETLRLHGRQEFDDAGASAGMLHAAVIEAQWSIRHYDGALSAGEQDRQGAFRLSAYFGYYKQDLEEFTGQLQRNQSLSETQLQNLKDIAHDLDVMQTNLASPLLESLDAETINRHIRSTVEPQLRYQPVKEWLERNP